MEKINETISTAKEEVKRLIKDAQEKKLEAEPGRTVMESFENKVNQVGLGHFFLLLTRDFMLVVVC